MGELHKHLEKIVFLYGKDSFVYIPNELFVKLSSIHESNVIQTSFMYAYTVTTSFLYQYTVYVDFNDMSYLQNGDIKVGLGYSRKNKTVDAIIKKGGILDIEGITRTLAKEKVPLYFEVDYSDKIHNTPIYEPFYREELSWAKDDFYKVVKNKNYTAKEPMFLFHPFGDRDSGTFYNKENTHVITVHELLSLIQGDFDNVDLMIYFYIKSKCKGFQGDRRGLQLSIILKDLNISESAYYDHLKKLKDKKIIMTFPNGFDEDGNRKKTDYQWKSIC